MTRKELISKIEFVIIYIFIGIVLLFQYTRAFTYEELFLFIELILTYIWTMGMFVYAKIKFDFNVFEPITMITAIYEGIFIVKPIVDLREKNMIEHGISVIGGGPKATFLFAVGYTMLLISYFIDHKTIIYHGHGLFSNTKKIKTFDASKISFLYIAWGIIYVLCIVCMLTQGLSLKYIFTFGSDGIREVDDNNTALLFLSNFGITLVGLWLMILEYSNNIFIKIITTLFCIVYILMRNARWLMLVFIVAPITFFYIKRKRQPELLLLVFVATIGLTIFAWMQANRTTMLQGGAMTGWGDKGFSLKTLLAPLESDLSTYRTFYSMVQRYPSEYSYVLGKTFIYALILFIPRVLWNGKPDNPIRDIVENSLNKEARTKGTAVSNIGEFYANFGIVGVVFFMYLCGWIAGSLKRYIFQNESIGDLRNRQLAYAILFPLFFQWIARGNFSANFYLTIFALLPFVFNRVFLQREQKNE